MDLVEFLDARFDEEEEATRGLYRRAQEHELNCRDPRLLGSIIPGWGDWPAVQQMAARALAECEAKRRVLTYYIGLKADRNRDATSAAQYRSVRWIVEQMTLPYRDHPDYPKDLAAA